MAFAERKYVQYNSVNYMSDFHNNYNVNSLFFNSNINNAKHVTRLTIPMSCDSISCSTERFSIIINSSQLITKLAKSFVL